MGILRLIAYIALAFSASGCFDVRTTDRGRWLIDDFENRRLKPVDPFEHWGCRPNPRLSPVADFDCGLAEENNNSTHALYLTAHLEGTAQVLVESFTHVPQDLSQFEKVTFSAKVGRLDTSTEPPTVSFSVRLTCGGVPLKDGGVRETLFLVGGFVPSVSEEWMPCEISLSKLFPPQPPVPSSFAEDPPACLPFVDGIDFAIDATGGSARVSLYVDDIILQ